MENTLRLWPTTNAYIYVQAHDRNPAPCLEDGGNAEATLALCKPVPADAGGAGGEEESDEPGSAVAQLAATHDHDLIVTFTAARVLYCGYTLVVEQWLKFLGSVVKPDLCARGWMSDDVGVVGKLGWPRFVVVSAVNMWWYPL